MNDDTKKEMTVPDPAVGAAEERPSCKKIADTIVTDTDDIVNPVEIDDTTGTIGRIGTIKKEESLDGFNPFVPIANNILLPDFPVNVLSPVLRNFICDAAKFTQTSHSMVASAILGTMAAAAQGKYVIEGYEGFQQPLNLYVVSVAEPGERKSIVMDIACRCIFDYELKEQARQKPGLDELKRNREILDSKIAVARTKSDFEELERLLEERDNLPNGTTPRFVTNDVTPEKLISLLSENHGVITVVSAEGGVFGVMENRYSSKTVNLDVWLNSYCGDPITVDRVSRDTEQISNPTLTMILSIQPITLASVLGNELLVGRGLVDRFLFCIPPKRSGQRHFRSTPLRDSVKEEFIALFNTLMEVPVADSRQVIYLSDEAFNLLDRHFMENEEYISGAGQVFAGWCSKYISSVLRIAGLLHLSEDPLGKTKVSEETMAAAIAIGIYYRTHAEYIYTTSTVMTPEAKVPTLLAKLKELGGVDIKRSTLVHSLRIKNFMTVADIQPSIDLMIAHGYIRMTRPESATRGKKPDFLITVRPELLI